MKLTDQIIMDALPAEKKYKLHDGDGLHILILPSGGKYFKFEFRWKKARKELSLGVYPSVSLERARNERDKAKSLIGKGINTCDIKKIKEHAVYSPDENTFSQCSNRMV